MCRVVKPSPQSFFRTFPSLNMPFKPCIAPIFWCTQRCKMSPFFPFLSLGSETSVTWGPATWVLSPAFSLSGCERAILSPLWPWFFPLESDGIGRGKGIWLFFGGLSALALYEYLCPSRKARQKSTGWGASESCRFYDLSPEPSWQLHRW